MSVIKVENLTFAYPTSDALIFDDVSFSIDTDWKLGFVGRNGRGKTTFLKLLCGEYEYGGKIISSVAFDYFPYAVKDQDRDTIEVADEICPTAEEWEILRELNYLDVDGDVLYRPYSTLSEGEKTKVLLAALFLNSGRFLLIDEPTNHLDGAARAAVAAYLGRKKGFILVSHDRSFLDGCVDHILSINRANIEVRSGDFSSFMQDFEKRQASEAAQNERLRGEIKRLKQSARQSAAWSDKVEATKKSAADSGFVGHKAAKMMSLSKNLEKRRQKAVDEKSTLLKNRERNDDLKIFPLTYRSERLASFTDLAPIYDGREVCRRVSFEIKRGDRIAVAGKNGSGKSSILKLICGMPIDHGGKLEIGSGLVVSVVPQTASHLYGTLSEFAAEHDIDDSLLRAILNKMGFDKRQFDKDISEFSGGQKKKTLIAKSLCESAHLYVWDEPLNFIDLYSRIQIENLIREFCPTMVFVEHDAAFCRNIATATIEL